MRDGRLTRCRSDLARRGLVPEAEFNLSVVWVIIAASLLLGRGGFGGAPFRGALGIHRPAFERALELASASLAICDLSR